jgi:type II secretory pathway component PulM
MLARWEQLDRREQLILALGALVAVLIIGWHFIWTPLDNRAAALTDEVDELSRLVVDLKRAAGIRGVVAGAGAAGIATSTLLAIVDQTARPLNLTPFESTRMDGSDGIYVTFRGAPFDVLNRWLTELKVEHNLAVEIVSISGSGTPGLVNGQVLLARS